MSTNIQIEKKLKNIKNFVGCFPINQIPKLNIKESVIINSDNDKEDGTHWMALKIISKKCCLFFDSFGEPPNKSIINFLSNQFRKIEVIYNSLQIQSIFSNKCGEFSMQFIYMVNDKKSFNKFISMFNHNNLLANDVITQNFTLTYLK